LHARTLRTHQTVTLSLLFLAGITNFLDRSSLAVANTTIRTEMHLSATQMGWLLTVFSFSYGLAQLPLIGMLDRAGTRAVLGAGLIVWSTAQLLTGFVRGLPSFLFLRVLLGIGEAPFYPAGVLSVKEWFSAQTRGRATAVMSMSQTVGLAAAPPALTWLMLRLGWRHTFVLLGASGLITGLAWVTLHRTRRETDFADSASAANSKGVLAYLIRQRTVWGMMLGFGGINYTSWLYISWLPGYLQEARHLSMARSGWLAAVPFLFGALGMMTSGLVADTLAAANLRLTTVHRANIVCGMILSSGCTFAVARATTTHGALLSISFALFFVHYAGTSGWGYVQAVSPAPAVASLTALQNFGSFMIASAAPVLTGWLLDRTHSFTIALGVCASVTLLGALSYATLAAPEGMRPIPEPPSIAD
jgi:sugar phosphate permease